MAVLKYNLHVYYIYLYLCHLKWDALNIHHYVAGKKEHEELYINGNKA